MSDLEKGLIAFESQNYTQGFNLLKPLAEEGNAEAQCIIANMYHLGLGIEINLPEALQWYRKSSQQGYGIASNNLATLYLLGGNGISQNKNEADRYFQKAREQGFLEDPSSCDYFNQASFAYIGEGRRKKEEGRRKMQ